MSAVAAARSTTAPGRAARALVELAARPAGWAVALLVLAAALAVGSVHPTPQTRAARIATLESSLKCPDCVDLSIRQSDTAAALDLRAEVVHLVDRGESNARIEATVVAQYGSAELLSPPASGIDTLVWVVPAAVLLLGGGVLLLVLARRRRRGAPGVAPPSAEDEALVLRALGRVSGGARLGGEADGGAEVRR